MPLRHHMPPQYEPASLCVGQPADERSDVLIARIYHRLVLGYSLRGELTKASPRTKRSKKFIINMKSSLRDS